MRLNKLLNIIRQTKAIGSREESRSLSPQAQSVNGAIPSMQLIQAKITGQPRTVTTKHGDRSVVDARAANGENLTIWRPANDPAVMRLANGERVQLAINAKGKVSLVETAFDRATLPPSQTMGFAVETTTPPAEVSRSIEIADYIERLGKLYSHCYQTAAKQLDSSPLATPEIKDVATTIFIQTVRHFSL
jgi:hypothetical protein